MKKSSELLLHQAAGAGNLNEFQRIESMQKEEFAINWNDNKDGETYLMAGSYIGHMNVVTYLAYLVEKGAIVDKKNMYGCRALSYAFLNNHLDVARLLLERGADPNVRPYDTNKFCCPIFLL